MDQAKTEQASHTPINSMPCLQAYIDFEIANRERDSTRALYERLLDRTKHVKVLDLVIHFSHPAMLIRLPVVAEADQGPSVGHPTVRQLDILRVGS